MDGHAGCMIEVKTDGRNALKKPGGRVLAPNEKREPLGSRSQAINQW